MRWVYLYLTTFQPMHKSFRNNEKTKTKAAFRKDKQTKQGHTASNDLKKKKNRSRLVCCQC